MDETIASILVWVSVSGFVVAFLAGVIATGVWVLSDRRANSLAVSSTQTAPSSAQSPSQPAVQPAQHAAPATRPPSQLASPGTATQNNPAGARQTGGHPAPGVTPARSGGGYRELLRQRSNNPQNP